MSMSVSTKKCAGFSYMEVIIAFALFGIVLIAVLPSISQAIRNMAYAQSHYTSHLAAQSIVLAVRETLAVNQDLQTLQTVVENYAYMLGITYYTIQIFCPISMSTISFYSAGVPNIDISLAGSVGVIDMPTIIVVIWNVYGHIAGRAVGMGMP